jgi:hypothetical protein
MKKAFLAAAALLAFSQAAFASANLDCTIKDKNAELTIEAITSRDGKYLDSLRGELQIAGGAKVEFDKSNVKSYKWDKNVALVIEKQMPQGVVELRINAKPKDEIDLEGSYTLTAAKTKKAGKVTCSGG